YTAPERLLPFAGVVIQYRSGCPSCMACGGVVDGDMQAEVMGIDTQLGELVGADQQVQGKLLVAEIEADDFRQEFAGKLPQRQLQRALEETVVRQGFQVLDVLAGDEVAIDEDMVLIRLAIAQLLQIGAHQVMHARVVPLLQHAVQPGTVDQLGRGNVAQEIQRMGAIGEEAPGLALAAGLDVFPVGPGGAGVVHQNMGLEPGGLSGRSARCGAVSCSWLRRKCRASLRWCVGACSRLWYSARMSVLSAWYWVSVCMVVSCAVAICFELPAGERFKEKARWRLIGGNPACGERSSASRMFAFYLITHLFCLFNEGSTCKFRLKPSPVLSAA